MKSRRIPEGLDFPSCHALPLLWWAVWHLLHLFHTLPHGCRCSHPVKKNGLHVKVTDCTRIKCSADFPPLQLELDRDILEIRDALWRRKSCIYSTQGSLHLHLWHLEERLFSFLHSCAERVKTSLAQRPRSGSFNGCGNWILNSVWIHFWSVQRFTSLSYISSHYKPHWWLFLLLESHHTDCTNSQSIKAAFSLVD